jgi:hypothetical protein
VAGIRSLAADTYTVHSTINQELLRAVEEALQEGFSRPAKSAEGAETASRNWRQLQPKDGRKRPPLVLVHEVCTLISGRKGSGYVEAQGGSFPEE